MVIIIWFGLIRFRKYFSAYTNLGVAEIKKKHRKKTAKKKKKLILLSRKKKPTSV